MENIVTPQIITSLQPNEIFVFGSNLQGLHAGGAARCAMKFGAEWGNGIGIQGNTYAIPTLSEPGGMKEHMLSLEEINGYVQEFIDFAKSHPNLFFYVTPIGCGIAGFTPQQIAPMFKPAVGVDNIALPEDFLAVMELQKGFEGVDINTSHEKTDFGDVWYVNSTDNSFRFAMYRYDDEPETLYLSNVFVSKENRRQGFGNAILAATDRIAERMSAESICLKVKRASFAHKWYGRHGYVDIANDEDEPNFVWMEKQI